MEEDKKVVEFLSKQKHVKLAYLFGSVAEGRKGKERKAERCGSGSFSG
jgi:predicted nucleotidyltransferase